MGGCAVPGCGQRIKFGKGRLSRHAADIGVHLPLVERFAELHAGDMTAQEARGIRELREALRDWADGMHRAAHGDPVRSQDLPSPPQLRRAQATTNQVLFALWVEHRDELERLAENCSPDEISLLKSSIRNGQLQQQL